MSPTKCVREMGQTQILAPFVFEPERMKVTVIQINV